MGKYCIHVLGWNLDFNTVIVLVSSIEIANDLENKLSEYERKVVDLIGEQTGRLEVLEGREFENLDRGKKAFEIGMNKTDLFNEDMVEINNTSYEEVSRALEYVVINSAEGIDPSTEDFINWQTGKKKFRL